MQIYFDTYISFIIKENKLKLSPRLVCKSKKHIDQLDFLVKSLIHIYLFILNILSVLIFFKPLSNLDLSKIPKLKKLLFLFTFFINKIDQIFFVIVSMHHYGEEEITDLNIGDLTLSDKECHFKFIVLGSGPSGAVTALELEKKYPGEVLLIERGLHNSIPNTKHPGEEFIKKWYRGGINSTYSLDMIAYSSGACFGGGSEINSGLYHEPDEEFLQKWGDEYGTKNLSKESLEPFVKKVEALTTKQTSEKTLFSSKFEEGARHSSNEYSYLPRFLNENGHRNSMSETLLKDYIQRNGKVKLEHEIHKIYYKDKKWFLKSKDRKTVYSCESLFICCGSVFTNNLLLKSRIINKNKKYLKRFKFHPMIKVIASYDEELQEINDDIAADQNIEFYPKFIIGNASSSLQFLISSFQKNIFIKEFIFENWKKMKVFHTTFSLGVGRIYNLPLFKDPILTYYLSKSDKKKLYEGFLQTMSFIKSTNATTLIPVKDNLSYNPKENKSDLVINSIKDIKGFQLSSVHILGGVTMGENINCIANSYGKVFDTNGLYVNDSSLINTPLLKNPQGTVMAIAYRNINNFIASHEIY